MIGVTPKKINKMFIVALYVSLILFIALSSVFARIEPHLLSLSEVKGAVLSSPACPQFLGQLKLKPFSSK